MSATRVRVERGRGDGELMNAREATERATGWGGCQFLHLVPKSKAVGGAVGCGRLPSGKQVNRSRCSQCYNPKMIG